MALDAKEVARMVKEELEKLGEVRSIGYVEREDHEIWDNTDPVLGLEMLDGNGVFITFENY